jgi:hypothetical protein
MNTKQQWAMPQLTIHGDVEQLTQQDTVKVKCPGMGDSLQTVSAVTREVNLPVAPACAS